MKTINIDGKDYVLKEDADNELKNAKKQEFKILSENSVMMDEANVLGIGAFQLSSDCVATRISVEYLEKVIKCLKTMSLRKEGLETIEIAWAKDFPAIIGTRNDKGLISGFVIAPRIER
jgi:hypothetical protein